MNESAKRGKVENMDKIRVRSYGTENAYGIIKDFTVVKELPTNGAQVSIYDPTYTWGKSKIARIDPEQRTGDDDIHREYDFYETEELDGDGELSEIHYFAVKNKYND